VTTCYRNVLTIVRRMLTFCVLTGSVVYHQCLKRYGDFNTPRCPCDQVIHIRSAVVGFSDEWERSDNLQRCPLTGTTCIRIITNHSAIVKCQGLSQCWIPRDIMYYSPYDKLCDAHKNGNAISITYDCINPGKINILIDLCIFVPGIFHSLLNNVNPTTS